MREFDTWTWDLRDPGAVPDVSIVICAHGKADVTLSCLRALIETQHMNLARAEVIVVDDASPDDTAARTRGIRGLTLVELRQNVGFLRAANAGLDRARGRHILFLNNDTEPVGTWLDPLVNTLDRRPAALVVGSRLVYPDGRLQEAGGIIFSDASGCNYGRYQQPFEPQFSFERTVDYVSGASLLVDGAFIRERGGFDEHFSPAYYEDTDLCFAAREVGGEVWYQPNSVVVHHEGVSHGTDLASGVKAYQAVNRQKFAVKWATELDRQHGSTTSPEIARQRSPRGRVLVIENSVPTPDRDSGSVRITAIIAALLDLGHPVTLLPANGLRPEPYTSRLEAMGVEVLGVPDRWWPFIERIGDSISHVWIARPEVAAVFLPRVRESLPRATVVYDTVDLHFLRLERQAALTGDREHRLAALRQEQQEVALIDEADVGVVVSPYEQQLLEGRTGTPIAVVPNIHVAHHRIAHPGGRDGVLFVGGFAHAPNVDAVTWFTTEVLPIVHRTRPGVHFTIAGSYPTTEVQNLAGEHVTVTGWVADLAPLYESTRVAVAPLRYGAGVKGKVGEAMSLGVPMVMTCVAGEGMYIEHNVHALVTDDAHAFARHVLTLLSDDAAWLRLSTAGQHHIESRFGVVPVRMMVHDALGLHAREGATA